LDAIKRGLTSFQGTQKSRKDALLARLARKEKISDEEEHWLDNDANNVDECALIQELETASDFERGMARLDSAKQKLLAKLKRLTATHGRGDKKCRLRKACRRAGQGGKWGDDDNYRRL
ncbi:hypothetical protein B0H14DRAFT_2922691, partial [Mycena olivaceomarginata]